MKREGDMPGAVDIRIEYGVQFIEEGRRDINQVSSRACHTAWSLELIPPYERVSCGRSRNIKRLSSRTNIDL